MLTTHDLEEAERLCSRIGLLNEGRLVTEGTATELKAAAATNDGREATLHDVFMTHTGRSLDDDVEEPTDDD